MTARTKFSIMMFLEFFIWGAWYPLASDYLSKLGFGDNKSWILNAFALASITAMFFSTQLAERNFAAEKFLALSHLVGGVAILALGWVTDFWTFFALMLVHSLFYVPTISIANSIAFANLANPQDDFGKVRLWGTIGWIAASLPFVFILVNWARVPALAEVGFVEWLSQALQSGYDPTKHPEESAPYLNGVSLTYVAAGIASLLLAAFSLTLPHTPPKPARADASFAWLEAMRLLNRPFLLVLFIATFIDAAVHQGYFVLTGSYLIDRVGIPAQWVMPVMTIGQVAEILTMAVLGTVLKTFGWRTTMIVGILGHAARFAVFAFFPEPAPAILINVLHGVCYAFFFATVYIFVDEHFPKDARASAQGLFNFLILGAGPFVGNLVWAALEARYSRQEVVGGITRNIVEDYQSLFLIPAATAGAAAVLLLLFFHPTAKQPAPNESVEEGAIAPAP